MPAKFSVAMCTFNGSRFIADQLESIAAQTRPPDELIVCDDDSPDETVEIVRTFASRAPFPVRIFINEQRLGSTRNFEKAASLCAGDLIAFSDQDDVWLPHKLASLEKEFENPAVGLVFSDAEIVDEQLRPAGKRMWHEVGFREREKRLVRKGRAIEVLLPGWSVMGATMAFRSKFSDLVLPIPTNLPMIHDGWIALMISAAAEVACIDDPLILYRQHQQQQIGAPSGGEAKDSYRITLEALKLRAHRKSSYAALVHIMQAVKQRLGAQERNAVLQQSLDRVEDRFQHITTRMNLSRHIHSRLVPVFRELISLRYYRYANGVASAAKDLFYGTRSD